MAKKLRAINVAGRLMLLGLSLGLFLKKKNNEKEYYLKFLGTK